MPAQPDPPLDVRHWELAEKLRSSPPAASDDLRRRVLALAEAQPSTQRRRLALPSRRLALVLAPAVVLVAIGGIVGIREAGSNQLSARGEALKMTPSTQERGGRGEGAVGGMEFSTPAGGSDASTPEAARQALRSRTALDQATTLPPGRRLQRYEAELRVHVPGLDGLGEATRQAMRTTRSLGGYVVVADFAAPDSEQGESLLVVRVPVGKVQDAIFRFSELGTILSQQVRVGDLQAGFNRNEERIRSLRRNIADLRRRLAASDLTPEERADLRYRLLNARQGLSAQLRVREATLRQGRFARVSLTLTTREGAAPAPSRPGYFERTLRDAFSVVGKALAWTLYVLVVAAPFLALALLLALAERARRRRADERLLERPAA